MEGGCTCIAPYGYWNQECENAFQQLKQKLVSAEVLVHYDPSLPLRLACDASAYGVGAVISHVFPNGDERPVAYASRTLTPSERNYRIAGKFGGELNLAVWRSILQPPN